MLTRWRDADRTADWILDQDIVLALGLKREGDVWVRPDEDYVEVARVGSDNNGKIIRLEIRAEHYKDYLAARELGLAVATFRSRTVIQAEKPNFSWGSDNSEKQFDGGRWKGSIQQVDDRGWPTALKWNIVRISRTDLELEDDAPHLGFPDEENTLVESTTMTTSGSGLFRITGELWRTEWVSPAAQSPRVRGDITDSGARFIVSVDGQVSSAADLQRHTQWLWFNPAIALDIVRKRDSRLIWYTGDTGAFQLPSHGPLHFGLNEISLISVLAKDIGNLPHHVQRMWAAHNVTPDGGVSAELQAAQMAASPAETISPENEFRTVMDRLENESTGVFGQSLMRSHPLVEELFERIHRFRAAETGGTYQLCKDITRATVDRLDESLLKKILPNASKDLKGLKLVELLLNSVQEDGRSITGPLHGVYDLRHADAHLPSSDADSSKELLGVDPSMTPLVEAKQIIQSVARAISDISNGVKKFEVPDQSTITR